MRMILASIFLCLAVTVSAASPFGHYGKRAPLAEIKAEANPQAQVTLFQPEWLTAILPDTMPDATKKVQLQSFAAQGEYEGFVFALRSTLPVKMKAEMTPFTAADGSVIDAGNFELRIQRTLETHKPVGSDEWAFSPLGMDLCEGEVRLNGEETAALFLDVRVPENAKPGVYKATLTLTGAAAPVKVPFSLRVLPFTLRRGVRSYGSYFLGRYLTDPFRSRLAYSSMEMLEKICRAHNAMGFNSAQFCEITPKLTYKDGQVKVDYTEIETIINSFRKAGNHGIISFEIRFALWWCDELSVILENRYTREPVKYTVESLEKLYPSLNAVEHNLKARWHKDYQLSELGRKFCRQVLQQVQELFQRNQWKDIYLVVEEEVGNGGLKLWGFEQFVPLVKEFPAMELMLYDNSPHLGIDMGHKHKDVVKIRQYNFITPELIQSAREDGRELWYYNRGWNRAAFGFPIWKLGARGMHMWADQWFDNSPYGEHQPRYYVWSVFYPSPSGPLPTLEGIRSREGIDDLAYLDTLVERIEKAKAAGKAAAAVAQAEKILAQLSARLPVTNQEFNDYRTSMTHASAFAERWKLASAILRIEKELAK